MSRKKDPEIQHLQHSSEEKNPTDSTPRDTLSNNTRFPVWCWKLFLFSHSSFL